MRRGEPVTGGAERSLALRSDAALAVAMGVGRFVFTPVLPLMEQQAHLAPSDAGVLASANCFGYFAGPLLGVGLPWTSAVGSRSARRASYS
jgi:predicted MFS family arabinose efflux permease